MNRGGELLCVICSLLLPISLEFRAPERLTSSSLNRSWGSPVTAADVQDTVALITFLCLMIAMTVGWWSSLFATLYGATCDKGLLKLLADWLVIAFAFFFLATLGMQSLSVWHLIVGGHPLLASISVCVCYALLLHCIAESNKIVVQYISLEVFHWPWWCKGLYLFITPSLSFARYIFGTGLRDAARERARCLREYAARVLQDEPRGEAGNCGLDAGNSATSAMSIMSAVPVGRDDGVLLD